MAIKVPRGDHWLTNCEFDLVPAGAVFSARAERSTPEDPHLTPSQQYGVITQQQYMEITGNRVVLNLTGADNMKHVEPGDYIIHLRSFQGGIELSRIAGKVSNAYTVLTPRTELNEDYFRYLLKCGSFIDGLASMTDQLRDGQNISYAKFSQLKLPLPNLDTQRAIADYLDRETDQIDTMLAKLDEFTERLEERRSTVVGDAVRDFEMKFPRASVAAIGSIHSGDTISADQIEESGTYPVYGGNGVRGFTENKNTDHDRVLVGRRGALCGNVHLAKAPFWASEHALVVAPHVTTDLRWLAYTLRDQGLGQLSMSAAQPGITVSAVGRQKIPLPPLDEQRRIADYLDEQTDRIDAMIAKAAQLKELLAERRSALITATVIGNNDAYKEA